MPGQFVCDICNLEFKNKGVLTRHKNRKTSCKKVELKQVELKQVELKQVELNQEAKNPSLRNMFKGCLDMLRDNETLIGDKALRNLTLMVILKLIEPRIGNEIMLDNYEYDFSHIEGLQEQIEHKDKLLAISRYSKLVEEKEENLPNNIKYLWDDILSCHNITQKIFIKNSGFDIKKGASFKRLMNKLDTIDLKNVSNDILGAAYEDVIKDTLVGITLGQFFTPSVIKELAIKLINPQVHPDGKIETCCDPTAGTGGFLINYIREIKKQANEKKIELDWEFIRKTGIYGREISTDTYQLAAANMLINTGYVFDGLVNGDSIRTPITQKFDNVIANPPFGISGLLYDSYAFNLKPEYLPIKTDNAASLILQAIIYMLNINGKCAIVLPTGQDITSKNVSYILIREYLMKSCDLQEIIYLPKGVFTNTGTSTCLLYFIKKVDGKTILEVKTSGKKITYNFTNVYQTSNVKFYDYDIILKSKTLLVDVPICKISENKFSLNYSEYMEEIEEMYDNTIEVKKLGDLCMFLPMSKHLASYGKNEGKYTFYISSMKSMRCDLLDHKEECLIIGSGGAPNINYGTNFTASKHCMILKSKTDDINLKYVYYYILNNLNSMKNLYVGAAIKWITKPRVSNIKIPLPSLTVQNTVVAKLDRIYESINEVNSTIETYHDANKRQIQRVSIIDHKLMTLGDICEIRYGTRIVKKKINTGKYNVYGSGEPSFLTDTFNRSGFNIIVGRFALSLNCVRVIYDENLFLNDSGLTIHSISTNVLDKYIGYYLLQKQNIIYNCSRGMAQKNLDCKRFKSIKIHIPPLEIQNQIVAACDRRNEMITELETFIEELKQEAKEILSDALRNAPAEPDTEEDNSIEEHDEEVDGDELLE